MPDEILFVGYTILLLMDSVVDSIFVQWQSHYPFECLPL